MSDEDFETRTASKAEFLANAFTTTELIDALTRRFEHLADNFRKIPNERYGQFHFQMRQDELAWLKRDEKDLAFRQEVFERFVTYAKDTDLSQIVFARPVSYPLGDDRLEHYQRGTIPFIKPDYSLKYGGV